MPNLKDGNIGKFATTIDSKIIEIIQNKDDKNNERHHARFNELLSILTECKSHVNDSTTPKKDHAILEEQFVKSILGLRVPAYTPPSDVFYSSGPVCDATVLQFLLDIHAISENTVTTLLSSLSAANLWKLLTARGTRHAVPPTVTHVAPVTKSAEQYKYDIAYVYPLHHLLARFPQKRVEIFVTLQEFAINAMLLRNHTSFSLDGNPSSVHNHYGIDWLATDHDKDRLAEILNVIPVSPEFVTFASYLRGRVFSTSVWNHLSLQSRLLFALEEEANTRFSMGSSAHHLSFLIKQPELTQHEPTTRTAFDALMNTYSTAEHMKVITTLLTDPSWKSDIKNKLLTRFLLKTSHTKISLMTELAGVIGQLLQPEGKLEGVACVPDEEKKSNGTKEMVEFLLAYAEEKNTTTLSRALVKVLANRWDRAAKSHESDKLKATNVLYVKAYQMLVKFVEDNRLSLDLTSLKGYKMLLLRQQEDLSPWIKLHEKIATTLEVLAKEKNTERMQMFTDWFAKLVAAKIDSNTVALAELTSTANNSIPRASAFESRLNVFSSSQQASRQELIDLVKECSKTEIGNYKRWLHSANNDTKASVKSKELRAAVTQKLKDDAEAVASERARRMEQVLTSPFSATPQ